MTQDGSNQAAGPPKPRLGVFKFASCDGCQLSVLNMEDELLALGEVLDIAYFPEASSRMEAGPYDIALVEGSVTTPEDARRILEVRRSATMLITIGACATSGGIQALRNWASVDDFKALVYPSPEYLDSLATSTPISAHVAVDYEVWGCPIDKGQLLRVLTNVVQGVRPKLSTDSVCLECKRRGTVCVLVAKGMACLGPVTRMGCGAICPAMGRECYGCFGPVAQAASVAAHPPNTRSLARQFNQTLGLIPADVVRRFRGITGAAESFKREGDEWAGKT